MGAANAGVPLLEARSLVKRYGALTPVNGVSLTVQKGEVVVICGPSGEGKSTFLRCFNGLTVPESGTLALEEGEVLWTPRGLTHLRKRVGMVFQAFHLFGHLTAEQNVALGLRVVQRMAQSQALERAGMELEQVGLGEKRRNYPHQLSGGQQQRVAIARALAMDPLAILFDEPTSALDPEMIGEVLQVMRMLAKRGMTMLVVTHEMGFARAVADRVCFYHDGQIVETNTPAAFFENPQHPRLRRFLERILHPMEADVG